MARHDRITTQHSIPFHHHNRDFDHSVCLAVLESLVDRCKPPLTDFSNARHLDCFVQSTRLNGSADAKFTNLLEDLLNLVVQLALSVLFSGIRLEVLLNLCHTGVCFGAESELDLDEGFETRIEVGDTEIDELWEFAEELLIELFVSCLSHLGFLLSTRELGYVLVGLLDELLDLCSHGIVVEELMIALLDTCEC